jgi:hypothetical protein
MKPYHLMSAAEKLAARIASNRELDTKVQPVLRAQETAAAQSYSRGVKRAVRRLQRSLVDAGEITMAIDVGRIARGMKPKY